MDKYQQDYGKFLISDDLRVQFSGFQTPAEIKEPKAECIIIETVVIDDAPSFTNNMEVTNA